MEVGVRADGDGVESLGLRDGAESAGSHVSKIASRLRWIDDDVGEGRVDAAAGPVPAERIAPRWAW